MTAPYRSDLPRGRDGTVALLRAEWTKFRTVRGWVAGMAAAGVVTVLMSVLGAGSSGGGGGGTPPTGPGGEVVTDLFAFVRQPLDGDGTITTRVTSLTGVLAATGRTGRHRPAPCRGQRPGS